MSDLFSMIVYREVQLCSCSELLVCLKVLFHGHCSGIGNLSRVILFTKEATVFTLKMLLCSLIPTKHIFSTMSGSTNQINWKFRMLYVYVLHTPQFLRLYMKTTNVTLVEVGFLSKSSRLVLVSKKYSKLKF